VLQEDYTKHNTAPEETDFMIDVVRLPKETNVAMLLKEQEDGTYKGSLRSRGHIDVQVVASLFNGGGHKAAAGFNTDLKPDEIIDKVSNAIRLQS
jgi:phosphoesterase RecJ-like protein